MSDARWSGLVKALAWPAAGAGVGVGVGLLAQNPESAPFYLGALTLVAVVMAGGGGLYWVRSKGRRRRALHVRTTSSRPKATTSKASPEPAKPKALPFVASLAFPGIPAGFPDVWGEGDAFPVEARASRGGRPAPGAPVRILDGDRLVAEGNADDEGRFVADLAFSEASTRELRVEIGDSEDRGVAERTLRVVRYETEIPRLVNDLRAWAAEQLPGALTLREIADALAARAPAAGKAAAEITLIFEVVEYGERAASRGLYERLLHAFRALEDAGALRGRSDPEEASLGA